MIDKKFNITMYDNEFTVVEKIDKILRDRFGLKIQKEEQTSENGNQYEIMIDKIKNYNEK